MNVARSEQRIAELATEDLIDRLSLDESNGWTNLQNSYSRVKATQRSLAIAEENLEISTYAYNEGSASILDVLQAQMSWLQIYTNTITAQYDYAVAIAAYLMITNQIMR
jgi:outer membrane protein TolC